MNSNCRYARQFLLAALLLTTNLLLSQAPISWDTLPSLIPFDGEANQWGLGGAYAGTHEGAIIIAGGNNFEGQRFWEGGTKRWYDAIMVWNPATRQWQQDPLRLPAPLSYGVAISTPQGLICIGGRTATQMSAAVYRLRWSAAHAQIQLDSLPPLPFPLSFMSGALVDETIYIAGGLDTLNTGSTKHFLSLNLTKEGLTKGWQLLESWPGQSRILPVAAAQGSSFYLFSGQHTRSAETNLYLTDSYRYTPDTQQWTRLSDVKNKNGQATAVFGAPSMQWGQQEVAIFGGVSGHINTQLEQLTLDIKAEEDSTVMAVLKAQKIKIYQTHPGFQKEVLMYNTLADTWSVAGQMPFAPVITSNAFLMNNAVVLANGEIMPGVRTPQLYRAQPLQVKASTEWWKYALGILGVGGLLFLLIRLKKKS